MGYKTTVKLHIFGEYLSSIRLKAGIKSQRQAADIIHRDLESGSGRYPGLENISYNQINADENGLVIDIPADRLRAYSILYKTPLEEIVTHLVEEKYGVTRTEKIEVSVSEIPDIVPPEEREPYELFRNLLDTKNREEVLTYLRILSQGASGNKSGSPVTTEAENKGAA